MGSIPRECHKHPEPNLVLAEPIKTGSTLCNTVYVHNKQEKKGPAPGAPKIGGVNLEVEVSLLF